MWRRGSVLMCQYMYTYPLAELVSHLPCSGDGGDVCPVFRTAHRHARPPPQQTSKGVLRGFFSIFVVSRFFFQDSFFQEKNPFVLLSTISFFLFPIGSGKASWCHAVFSIFFRFRVLLPVKNLENFRPAPLARGVIEGIRNSTCGHRSAVTAAFPAVS